ncbi:hypothetical protein [Ferruginibacter sp. HRS2-29]|uniref:hypothetical protein n=1 Tax=Ferruginibacter sp. HRS2-29 TaxID=2487334 RepID=UPI0020CDA03D|nr:hypothetical protein [Ferruginibacter sp. HRS2-29]MCP9751231.1 hypothetical protein [Ferruginibacter sp. HRS2-29]
MSERFEIPLTYNGKEHNFAAELISTGYSYKIMVDVFDTVVSFEPDEERNFRAVTDHENLQRNSLPGKALLEEIANTLISIFKD